MADFVGALDQGTTSTRFMVFDRGGNEISRHQLEHEQIFPQPGWVEHDPRDLLQCTLDAAREAIRNAGVTPQAIGITNQRETVVL